MLTGSYQRQINIDLTVLYIIVVDESCGLTTGTKTFGEGYTVFTLIKYIICSTFEIHNPLY